MFTKSLKMTFALTASAAVLASAAQTSGQGPQHSCHHGMHMEGSHDGHDHGAGTQAAGNSHESHQNAAGTSGNQVPQSTAAPHSGQITTIGAYIVEVVYRPRETRVYLYSSNWRPVIARDAQGHLAMQAPGSERVYRFPLHYVAPKAVPRTHDYLSAAADVSQVPDGGMTVTVSLENLPNPRQSQATFSQVFALSKPPVTIEPPHESDRPQIQAQKVCPVSGSRLGSMGTPVKVLIAGKPFYLCCKGCLGKLEKNPEFYLRRTAQNQVSTASEIHGKRILTETATAADQVAIDAQRECPVKGTTLGEHGTPIKISVGERTLFVCCKTCVGPIEKNPEHYLAKAAKLRQGR